MSAHDNGGPAFPAPDLGEQDFSQRGAYPGMTLRDYFAAKALQPLVENKIRGDITYCSSDAIAQRAYELADAMLKARGGAQ